MAAPLETYGLTVPSGTNQADIELILAFNHRLFVTPGWLGRFQHLKNAIDLIWNEPRRGAAAERKLDYDPDKHDAFIWNEWSELMLRAFVEPQAIHPDVTEHELIVAGAGATWKTTCMAMGYLCMWLASPADTRIILTSTTGDGLRARVWKELVGFWRSGNGTSTIGNLVQSRTMIQFIKGDDGAGIFGIAVESDGNVDKAINKIIGRHNTNMGVGIDEMPTVSGAIVEACVNLTTGAERFQLWGVGNPDSHFDPHGLAAEPADGWESITIDTLTWRTKRGGIAVHLNGFHSPRIGNDDKFPGMIRQADLERTAAQYGSDSPQMYKQRLGFWPPESLSKTIISESLITKFKATEKAIWVGEPKKGAGVDPAFEGGDRCVLRIGKVGMIDGGTVAMTCGKPITIKVDVSSQEPIHHQLARKIHEHCAAEDVPKDMLAIDSTGEGDGVASILIRDYGYNVLRVEFGGRASDAPVSVDNPKPAFQEWINRVTEIWYRFREILRAGQVRELDTETADEFCRRRYEMKGNLVQAETKRKMKARGARSPDYADAACVLAMLFFVKKLLGDWGGTHTNRKADEWNRVAKKMQLVDDEAYLVAD